MSSRNQRDSGKRLRRIIQAEAERKLATAPDRGCAYFAVGNSARIELDYRTAIMAFQLATESDPGNTQAHQMLGIAYADLGQNHKAIRRFKECVRLGCRGLDPEIEEENPYYHLGWCFEDLGYSKAAEKALRGCIEVAPCMFAGHVRLGRLHQDSGKFGLACETYSRGIEAWRSCDSDRRKVTVLKNLEFNRDRAKRKEPYSRNQPSDEEKKADRRRLKVFSESGPRDV